MQGRSGGVVSEIGQFKSFLLFFVFWEIEKMATLTTILTAPLFVFYNRYTGLDQTHTQDIYYLEQGKSLCFFLAR